MQNSSAIQDEELREAYRAYDQQVTLKNIQTGCILGVLLMPAGWILDRVVYGDPENAHLVGNFLIIRFVASALIGIFWAIVVSSFGRRFYRELGVGLAMIPAGAIAVMILMAGGASSPYYAGLNLVLLVVGFVVRWTFRESLSAVILVVTLYVVVCVRVGIEKQEMQMFINNMYFLVLTGIIVVTGDYFRSQQREREFALRFEVEKNRKALEAQNNRLRELDEAKSQFFANISHELRTPLTLLLAPLQGLRTEKSHLFDDTSREWLETMNANGMRLLKLINDLLDLVRLDSGSLKLRREQFNVPGFMRGLVSAVNKMAKDKGIEVVTAIDPNVTAYGGDEDKLEKVFLNLIFNAIKFTPAGGKIVFGAKLIGDSDMEFEVSDTGMGIPEEQLNMIFTRFWQADMTSQRKYQGVGIGLALVKDLVDLHEGKIEVTSKEGEGTKFRITLPIVKQAKAELAPAETVGRAAEPAPAPTGARSEAQSENPDEWLSKLYRRAELFPSMTSVKSTIQPLDSFPLTDRRARLLIADDEPDMLRFLKSHLGSHFQVLEAVDGRQAIEKAQQYEPDVIICDMMMPEVDGLEVCRRLREREGTKHVPILLLTARADEETKITALTAGASDFLSKPFSTTELRVRVTNLCESHLLQRQLAWQNKKLEATLEQLKETETSLVQSEKMASLGRMSAGIIHEINNPLNYAKGALHALKKKKKFLPEEEWPDFEEIITDTEDGFSRVAAIVSDLRTFSHPNNVEMSQINLRDVFETALKFTSHEWREKVKVENRLPAELCVMGNRHKLVQVTVNLLQNALDALKGKGFSDDERPAITIDHQHESGADLVRIRDNGPGMSAETASNIFEPFYTTKKVGEGMGLGLSVCYRIISEHGGRIDVRSEIGKYCEFTLEFPTNMTN